MITATRSLQENTSSTFPADIFPWFERKLLILARDKSVMYAKSEAIEAIEMRDEAAKL